MGARSHQRASLALFLLFSGLFAGQFLEAQRSYPRFRSAEQEKLVAVQNAFAAKKISLEGSALFIRVFKREAIVELWARERSMATAPYSLIRSYPICASSGELGPKRKIGDGQVPEGAYTIDRFNPQSNFHLSLGINYPNLSDKILSAHTNLGGDIFIHGNCVTIGCIPIGDEAIKELYLICVYARDAGQTAIPVHIFPLHMNETGMEYLQRTAPSEPIKKFWQSLQPIYSAFENGHRVPSISVDTKGYYRVR